MISSSILAILSVLAVSALSFLGVLVLSFSDRTIKKYTLILVSLAVGALLGDAFIHLIPEAFANAADPLFVSLTIIVGILLFFIIEKVLHWHHHNMDHAHAPGIHPTGLMILVSDGIHNFTDGLIIGVSYMVSIEVGIATTAAVMLHEIPQEIGDFGVLIHAGFSRMRALMLNFVSGLLAVVGAVTAIVLGQTSLALTEWILPLAAGGFVYVAMGDLIPELQKTKDRGQSLAHLFAMIIGIGLMVLLLGIE